MAPWWCVTILLPASSPQPLISCLLPSQTSNNSLLFFTPSWSLSCFSHWENWSSPESSLDNDNSKHSVHSVPGTALSPSHITTYTYRVALWGRYDYQPPFKGEKTEALRCKVIYRQELSEMPAQAVWLRAMCLTTKVSCHLLVSVPLSLPATLLQWMEYPISGQFPFHALDPMPSHLLKFPHSSASSLL